MSDSPTIRDNFLLFWSEWPSNWEPSPFVLEGVRYNCVEQYMMAEKARLFGDTATLKAIMKTTHPREQKRLGRGVRGYNEAKWASARYDVVLRGNLAKYRQNPLLRELLLATGNLRFVEASPMDKIWGIGLGADHPNATTPSKWQGKNLLGKVLDEVRTTIRNESF